MKRDCILISPVRNEERHLGKTIQSVLQQTVRPSKWIIVDDGSTDRTAEIARQCLIGNPWVSVLTRRDRGFASVGEGEAAAFNEAYETVRAADWDFIAKVDGDVSFPKDHLESLLRRFEEDPKLGISGGTCFVLEKGRYYEEKMPDFYPLAACRLYRRKCYEEIGGIIPKLGWETIDLLRAQMRGWATRRFEDLRITHYRRMASRGGLWKGKTRSGKIFYVLGYLPLFVVARSLYRLKERPYFIESAGILYGYLRAFLRREPLSVTREEKAFLRRQQRDIMLGLKI